VPALLEQSAAATVAKYQSRTCTATFTAPTKPGSTLIVVCAAAGTLPSRLQGPEGFTLIGGERGLRDIQMSVWVRQNAPRTTSVSVTALDAEKSLQVRAIEYSGLAQTNVVDKLVIAASESPLPYTGSTGTLSQADELVLGFVVNQYASTSQIGIAPGLVRLFETVSPSGWSRGDNEDWERSRLTVHQAIPTTASSWSLFSVLSTTRRWLTLLVTLRGAGGFGPARMTSTKQAPVLSTEGGRGRLDVFGPLASKNAPAVLDTAGGYGRIGPSNYQYRLGGWTGFLIGTGTPWRIEEVDGLEGWDLRTSDDELPRGDGALRGVDLQAARQVMFKLNADWGAQKDSAALEKRLDELYRALVPQRDTDWELIWRHPGRPLRMLRCRPTNLIRGMDLYTMIMSHQSFALRAADPRHYSAFVRRALIPQTPLGVDPQTVTVINAGNGAASPLIRIVGPTSGDPLRRVELVNRTQGVTFAVEAVVPSKSTLLGDMEARATGAPRSVVTIDGQSKYGAWQHPRTSFFLGPGGNDIYLRTDPPAAPITCALEYRDTWSG
jgi:hypothetical protein